MTTAARERLRKLALAAAVVLVLGLVLAVAIAVAKRRFPTPPAPVLEWTLDAPGEIFLDDEAVYVCPGDRVEVRSLVAGYPARTLTVGWDQKILGLAGRELVAARGDRLEVLSRETGAVVRSFDVGSFSHAAFSSAGIVAVASWTQGQASVALRSLADGALVGTCTADVPQTNPNRGWLGFSPADDLVVAKNLGASQLEACVWRLPQGTLVGRAHGTVLGITRAGELALSKKGRIVFHGADGALLRELPLDEGEIAFQLAADRVLLYRSRTTSEKTERYELGVLDLATGERLWLVPDTGLVVTKFSASGRHLLLVAEDAIKVWKLDP